jgi:hypothetical protein
MSSSYGMHTVASPVGNLGSLDRILANLHVPEDLPVRNLEGTCVEWLYDIQQIRTLLSTLGGSLEDHP